MSGPKRTPWTPGPWRAVQRTGRVHRAADEWLVTAPGVEEVVCRVERWTPEQDEADARLIAAAPRLAAELAAWRAWAERWGRDIETSVSVSPITHNELVERLAATNAALREAGVTDDA